MRLLVLATAISLLISGLCAAEGDPDPASRPVNIPAQELRTALQALGRGQGVQIVYQSDIVGHIRSPGAMGALTVNDAVAQLLQGTGLTYRYVDEQTITIVPAGVDAAAASEAVIEQLEEVIVTAQKTIEVASRTPLSLSNYSGRALKEQGINNASDLPTIAPAVTVGRSPAGITLGIRGVTTTDVTSKGDQGIAFNVDGIPIGRPRQMETAFFDLERIEVLRGPQGTLYGKSSTGGAINIITNKPHDLVETSASLESGNYNAERGDVMVNIPFSRRFGLRVAGSFTVHDDYLNPVLGNYQGLGTRSLNHSQDELAGRASGLWRIGDTATLLMTGSFGRIGGTGVTSALVDVEAPAGPPTEPFRTVRARRGAAAANIYYDPFGALVDEHFHNYNTELNVDIGAVHLTYSGAILQHHAYDRTSSNNDPAGRGGTYGYTDYQGTYDTESHELRLSGTSPQRVDWVLGANYYGEKIRENDHSWNAPASAPTLAASVNATGILADTTHRSTGIFGQARIHASELLRFTLGLRNSSDGVQRHGTFAAGGGPAGSGWLDPAGNPCVAPSVCVGAPNNGSQSASKVTYRLGADYLLTSQRMAYVSVATGYKAGGFNDFGPGGGASAQYEPEQLTAYEVGFKAQVRSRLQLSTAAFYYDYSKNQISSVVLINGLGVLFTRTVPTIIRGLEGELHYKITDVDLLELTASVENSRYRRFQAGVLQSVDWSGQSLDNTPSTAMAVALAHRWISAAGGYVEARLSSHYDSGHLLSDFAEAVHYRQRDFSRTDIGLTYNSASGRFGVQAYVRNLEGRSQLIGTPINVSDTVANSANAPVSDPRTFGIRLVARYAGAPAR